MLKSTTDGGAYAFLTGTRKIPARKTEEPSYYRGPSEELISSSTSYTFDGRYFPVTIFTVL